MSKSQEYIREKDVELTSFVQLPFSFCILEIYFPHCFNLVTFFRLEIAVFKT